MRVASLTVNQSVRRSIKIQKTITNIEAKGQRIKVGFVSADFYRHSVSYFIVAPLKYIDNRHFEIFCYANVEYFDERTEMLMKLVEDKWPGNWKKVSGLNEFELAQKIDDDGIDILVDLSGHTSGNRLKTFALKPAPVQMTWIGYANTTGLCSIDYRLVDHVTDPIEPKKLVFLENLENLESFIQFIKSRGLQKVDSK